MKRHNFNVDFDKDVLQNDAELMESIDFLLYKSSQNNRKYKIVEILRESYYDGVICLGRVMELEEIFHFDLRRFMLKNPYIYICEDAIRSKTITDVNKFRQLYTILHNKIRVQPLLLLLWLQIY